MKAEDVTDTLNLALAASGRNQAIVRQRPRLLSDNGTSPATWPNGFRLGTWITCVVRQIIRRPRAKSSGWHQTLKNRILLENYFLPGDLETQIDAFVEHYNHHRYHESLDNLIPAQVYFGRGQTILLQRERIKRKPSNYDACSTAEPPRKCQSRWARASTKSARHLPQKL